MNKKYTFLVIIFLIVISGVAFGRITVNEFINFDDNIYITENNHIKSGINAENIKWYFTDISTGNWHPLTMLSHSLDWSIFGDKTAGHHLVSLFLHIGTVIFLFLFLNKTTNNIWPSAFAAAFFSLHPLRVESVAWAAERKDVLNLFFTVLCFYAYAFYVREKKLSQYALSLMIFILAVMSKPIAVTIPFVLLLLDYWPLNRWPQKNSEETQAGFRPVVKLVGEKIPFFCVSIAASIAAVWSHSKEGTVASLDYVPVMIRVSNAIVAYASYLAKIFWPANLAVFYPLEPVLPLWEILSSAAIILFITLIVIYYVRKKPYLFTGWFIYLGTLVPVIGLVQVGSQAMADRYTYLPSVGMALTLAWGIPSWIENKKLRRNILTPAAIIFLCLMMLFTWRQCHYWKNSVSVFSHSLRVTQNNALANNHLGLALYEKGRDREALYHFDQAILLQPKEDSTHNNRGAIYLKYDMLREAFDDFSKAIAINPGYVKAFNNRANLYMQTGQHQLALNDWNEAIRIKPDYILGLFNRGVLLARLGDYQKSISDFNRVIALNPNHGFAYVNRASLYLNTGNIKAGCSDAQKACALGQCEVWEAAGSRGDCR